MKLIFPETGLGRFHQTLSLNEVTETCFTSTLNYDVSKMRNLGEDTTTKIGSMKWKYRGHGKRLKELRAVKVIR